MNKSIATILVVSMLLALTGCAGVSLNQEVSESSSAEPIINSDEEFAFVGESESWAAKLVVNPAFMLYEEDGTYHQDGDEKNALYVTYKGDISDLASVKNLRIVCGEDSMENAFSNDHSSTVKTFKLPVSLGEINKDDKIDITVTADDHTQTLQLKTSNSKEAFSNGNDDFIENHYVFEGESDSWTGEMMVDSTMQFYEMDGILGCDTNERERLIVTYKGDVADLAVVKHLEIDYDAPLGGGSLQESYDPEYPLQEKTFTLSGGGSGVSLIQEDAVITVTVTIDGKTETFVMKNNA